MVKFDVGTAGRIINIRPQGPLLPPHSLNIPFILAIQHLADPVGRSRGLGNHHKHAGNGHHGVEDYGKISHKRQNLSHLAGSGVDPVSSHNNHTHQP